MYLVKTQSGLLELDNYFIYTPLLDLAGDGTYYQNEEENKFVLAEGTIERNFPYDNCVIHVKKEHDIMRDSSEIWFYLRNEYKNVALIEKKNDAVAPATEWLLVRHNGFTEFYSFNGEWKHTGGTQHSKYPFQGFKVEHPAALTIKDYKVYSSPYCYIANIPPNAEVLLYEGVKLIDNVYASTEGTAQLCIYRPRYNLKLIVKYNNQIIIEQFAEEILPGDSFLLSPYNIGLVYNYRKLSSFQPQLLTAQVERVELVNYGEEDYADIVLTLVEHDDRVKISWSTDFSESSLSISTPLAAFQTKELFLKITPLNNAPDMRKFGIVLSGIRTI